MKITLFEAVQSWNVLTHLKSLNNSQFPDILSGNLAYLRPEIQKWNQLSKAEREVFGDSEIELPLKRITKKDLPEVMPVDMYEALNPIAKGTFKNRKTELEKLLEEKQEAEENRPEEFDEEGAEKAFSEHEAEEAPAED